MKKIVITMGAIALCTSVVGASYAGQPTRAGADSTFLQARRALVLSVKPEQITVLQRPGQDQIFGAVVRLVTAGARAVARPASSAFGRIVQSARFGAAASQGSDPKPDDDGQRQSLASPALEAKASARLFDKL